MQNKVLLDIVCALDSAGVIEEPLDGSAQLILRLGFLALDQLFAQCPQRKSFLHLVLQFLQELLSGLLLLLDVLDHFGFDFVERILELQLNLLECLVYVVEVAVLEVVLLDELNYVVELVVLVGPVVDAGGFAVQHVINIHLVSQVLRLNVSEAQLAVNRALLLAIVLGADGEVLFSWVNCTC